VWGAGYFTDGCAEFEGGVNVLQTAQRYLEYPKDWTDQSKDRYETLYALELVTQADIWAIEERLIIFRSIRDEFCADKFRHSNPN
jgi:hypothetical protein